jgi:hypothetical protein
VSKHHLTVVTNSQLSTFRRCQREHSIMYHQGYRSVEDVEALRFGDLWHRGLEALFCGRGLEHAIAVATTGAADAYEAAKLRVLLTGYDARWSVAELGDEVVGVEETFVAPLINPETGHASTKFSLGGKLDVRMRASFMEHKTTSDDIGMGSLYWRTLTLDSQVSTYYAGARQLGTDPQRCVYDVVKKPGLRPKQVPLVDDSGFKIVLDANRERVYCKVEKKGVGPKPRETGDTKLGYELQTRDETPAEYEERLAADVMANPDAYYQRGEVVRLEAELREAEQDAWHTVRQMREAELAGRAPRNASACRRYGAVCAFFDVCCGVASLEDTSRFVKLTNVHPELGEMAEAAE